MNEQTKPKNPNIIQIGLYELKTWSGEGRASRREYWSFQIFYFATMYLVRFLPLRLFSFKIIPILFFLAAYVPHLCVGVRRLHDINRSGYWLGIPVTLFSIIGWITFNVMVSQQCLSRLGFMPIILATLSHLPYCIFIFIKGNTHPNQYGEYESDAERIFDKNRKSDDSSPSGET